MSDAELFNLVRSCRNALGKEKDVLEYFATSGADSLSLGQGAGAAIIALALLMVTYSNHLEAQRADAAAGSESTDLSAHLLGESKESGALKVQVHGVGEKGY